MLNTLRLKFVFFIFTSFTLFIPLTAISATISITTDTGQGADTYVRGGPYVNDNFGSSELILVKNAGTNGMHVARKAYIRFDLSSVTTAVASASLSLTFSNLGIDNVSNNFNVYALNDGVGENWGENTITWNSAPANATGSPGGLTGDSTLLGSFGIPLGTATGEIFTISGNAFTDFINADTQGLVTFIITADLAFDDAARFFAKENLDGFAPPTLTLAPVPIPAAVYLLGTGLIGLLAVRSKRTKV